MAGAQGRDDGKNLIELTQMIAYGSTCSTNRKARNGGCSSSWTLHCGEGAGVQTRLPDRRRRGRCRTASRWSRAKVEEETPAVCRHYACAAPAAHQLLEKRKRVVN